jgi:3-oxoacyl-(acyl-carrier-protein) synthase
LPVNVVKEISKSNLRKTLKTASGFGGCNAALVMIKD